MGKRKSGRRNNPREPSGYKKPRLEGEQGNWSVVKHNEKYAEYYRDQLGMGPEECEKFLECLKENLPICFRINCDVPNYKSLIEKLESPEFLPHFLGPEELEAVSLKKVEWYPDSLVWCLTMTRREMKKSQNVKDLHKFLQDATAGGLITRQELVSMLPPLILDIQPGMKVLDACAAPGSKTAQIIEYLHGDGIIVANDVDTNRAYMLIH